MANIHLGPGGMASVNQGMQMNLQQQQIQLQTPQQQQQIPQQLIQQQPMNPQQQPMIQQPQQPQPPQQQPPPPATDPQKLDHVSKVKSLLWPLKESLATTMKLATQNFLVNGMIDIGNLKGTDAQVHRFDKQLEDFYAICDQIEMNLQAIINCTTQATSSQKYIPAPVTLVRPEPALNPNEVMTYQNYLNIARHQTSFIKDIVDSLNEAAQNLSAD